LSVDDDDDEDDDYDADDDDDDVDNDEWDNDDDKLPYRSSYGPFGTLHFCDIRKQPTSSDVGSD